MAIEVPPLSIGYLRIPLGTKTTLEEGRGQGEGEAKVAQVSLTGAPVTVSPAEVYQFVDL